MDKPPLSPYGAFIGISIDDFSEGKVTCSVALRDHHLNNGGRVHGGVLTSLADTAAGAAVRTVRPEGKLTATTDLSISFLRPPVGNQLVAVAEVLHAGKRLFRVEIEIFCLEKLVAKTNATFMLVEKSKY
ncbi:MAG: PaaI family thioesterase [Pseudohongiellaceae bacterium]|nr:phenylacetic acid degradation protein [Gammaproteobacteria bacterium]OUV76227.1 MAG: hypothetical protein CBC99_03835 [Gammaproteobacteria bacterium TMED139]|tara:strand:+ start:1992 stop:2381 length:390 start_codon:yes stop_codon:yes gene_type:complete